MTTRQQNIILWNARNGIQEGWARHTEEQKKIENIRVECFISRIPLLRSMLLLLLLLVLIAVVRAQCLRLGHCISPRSFTIKSALFFIISFHFVSVDGVAFGKFPLSFCFTLSERFPLLLCSFSCSSFSPFLLQLYDTLTHSQRPEHYSKWIVEYMRDRSPTRPSFCPHI